MIQQERFCSLPDYPFSRLRNLLDKVKPLGETLDFSIGEPKHSVPSFVAGEIVKHTNQLNNYPANFGSKKLLEAISLWLASRYSINPPSPDTDLMALNGSREGIFNATLALCNKNIDAVKPVILIPNPFYQCYLAAALAADAEPVFVPAMPSNSFLPDFSKISKKTLNRTSILMMCSPSNPQGAVADLNYWKSLLNLAELYGFKIFSDEVYSEIYRGIKPIGILQASAKLFHDPEKSLSFNSLSKRSNLPGLRSGFVCGGQRSIKSIKKLRSYGGAPLPIPVQEVSILAWSDEKHVEKNRKLYRKKYELADSVFKHFEGYNSPNAGFFLWLRVGNGEKLTYSLWKNHGVRCLPGAYLTNQKKNTKNFNDPGFDFIRIALVNSVEKTMVGLKKVAESLQAHPEKEI